MDLADTQIVTHHIFLATYEISHFHPLKFFISLNLFLEILFSFLCLRLLHHHLTLIVLNNNTTSLFDVTISFSLFSFIAIVIGHS